MKNLYKMAVACCRSCFAIILLLVSFTGYSQEFMRANLYSVDGNGTAALMDGNLTEYNNIYSNDVDIYDAWKMTNPGANFGILRSGYNLSVERRSLIQSYDTTFFRMWNIPQYNYRLKLILKNLNHISLRGYLRDSYLRTETLMNLNDTSNYDFTVNADPASSAESRFEMVFAIAITAPVDVSFTSIQVQRKGTDAFVQWQVANESSIESYSIEHSFDGSSFTAVKQLDPYHDGSGTKDYSYLENKVSKADIYYRIKAVSMGGKIQYSNIAKINQVNSAQELNVYPNPVVNKTVQLQINNFTAGRYNIVLLSGNGVQEQLESFMIADWQLTKQVNLPKNIAPGIYRLIISGAGNTRVVKTINVL